MLSDCCLGHDYPCQPHHKRREAEHGEPAFWNGHAVQNALWMAGGQWLRLRPVLDGSVVCRRSPRQVSHARQLDWWLCRAIIIFFVLGLGLILGLICSHLL